jgi:hypothetical protein
VNVIFSGKQSDLYEPVNQEKSITFYLDLKYAETLTLTVATHLLGLCCRSHVDRRVR